MAAELTPAAVADPKGDGPDGKGNTADDTWQFWFQLVRSPQYRRLDLGTAAMSKAQRKDGIPRKVRGPIGGSLPNAAETEGWIYHSDWDGRFEGVWGDKKVNQVLMHPYNEKTDGAAVAVTWKAPADGKYTVAGKVTDLQVVKSGHPMMTGVIYFIDVVEAGGVSITTKGPPLKQGKVGDNVGPESEEFKLEGVQMKKGQLLRLAIDPNKSWGADMTKVELKIVPAS